jgi:uncharacterized membrane protein YheB (UPF0754 family)
MKKVKVCSWIHPQVHTALQRQVERTGLSRSVLIAAILEKAVDQSIEEQYATRLEPMIRKILREEFQAFGNRIVHFLMITGFAAEQGRLLISNVLERVLRLLRVPDVDDILTRLCDRSNDTARKNVIEGMPPIHTLEEEWRKRNTDEEEERLAYP